MKKIFLIIIVSLLANYALATGAKTEMVIKSCYRDYLNAFAVPGGKGRPQEARVRKRCLSKSFLKKWESIVSVDGTSADGLLLSQDYLDSWLTKIQIQNLNEEKGSGQVLLGEEKQLHCLNVLFIGRGTNSKISAVSKCKE